MGLWCGGLFRRPEPRQKCVMFRRGDALHGDQFGSTGHISRLVQHALPTALGQNPQLGLRLRFVIEVQPQRCVIAADNSRRVQPVQEQQTDQIKMRFGMTVGGDRRAHVNDSFDEFRFLQFRHGFVAPLELRASQPVAVLQGRQIARRSCQRFVARSQRS
jgi:hypothetical protein